MVSCNCDNDFNVDLPISTFALSLSSHVFQMLISIGQFGRRKKLPLPYWSYSIVERISHKNTSIGCGASRSSSLLKNSWSHASCTTSICFSPQLRVNLRNVIYLFATIYCLIYLLQLRVIHLRAIICLCFFQCIRMHQFLWIFPFALDLLIISSLWINPSGSVICLVIFTYTISIFITEMRAY